jgi:RNA polymerase sigma factor (sigma-70 family)
MEALLDISGVVRRVVAARVKDARLAEDLTQETLVRLAGAGQGRDPDAMRAYAIVTARNVVVSHGRTQLVHDRHLHRLVERTTTEGPEELVVEREDAQAMVVALSRLDGTERELLVRHEVGGETTQALAAELGTSAGALAMRLARARATLRLEYVLVSRNIELPSRRCRAVLLSLSTRDLRRQRDLDVATHLQRCATCGPLADAVGQRPWS